MAEFDDPFLVTATPDLCSNTPCPDCKDLSEDCLVCGYPSGVFELCQSSGTPCLDGAVDCLDCESSFSQDIKFLGGFVSGFSSRLGFGASESSVTIDIVLPKYRCPDPTISSPIGVCCEPDESCSSLYSGQEDCENAGGTWFADKSCDDNPCSCPECGQNPRYEGKLGYIYTFNMGAFCFRGILSNHNYTEDSSGYKYRITLVDGRSILSNIVVLLNGIYIKLPNVFKNSVINIAESEGSVIDNTCGNGLQCGDFMTTGTGSIKGVKIKSALEAIDGKCVSIPVSNAGLNINVSKLINVISDELRTTNTESTVIELITLACEESGYDFLVSINNDNEFEILPINYKRPATEKSLFNFIEDLATKDIVISKDYGEEMAGTASKNKRIVIGNNISYLTSVRDFPYQLNCSINIDEAEGVCCKYGLIQSIANSKQDCDDLGGTWYAGYSIGTIDTENICKVQPACTIKNNPASIGSYESTYTTPAPYPSGC